MPFSNSTVSTVIRIHDPNKLDFIDQAIFSLSVQSYPFIQLVIVAQNFNENDLQRIQNLLQLYPFEPPEDDSLQHKVLSIPIAPGEDGRAELFNEGVKNADGRYLAILDYDDVVYQRAYDLLVHRAQKTQAAVIVGGARIAFMSSSPNQSRLYCRRKQPFTTENLTKWDLFSFNFLPCHSFILDRNRLDNRMIHFTPGQARNEDYECLLKLAANCEFDFTHLLDPVAEYRIRDDGTNTILSGGTEIENNRKLWDCAEDYIQRCKESLQISLTGAELAQLLNGSNRNRQDLIRQIHQLTQERNSVSVRLALKFQSQIRRFPRVKNVVLKLIKILWFLIKIVRNAVSKFFSNFRVSGTSQLSFTKTQISQRDSK